MSKVDVVMRIGIILDNPKREIDGIAMLSYQLVVRGHDVYIVPMYQQGFDVPLLDLDAVLVNYARSSNLEYLKAYSEMGIRVFVLDTEGGVLSERPHNAPSNPSVINASGVSRYIDHYLFWGVNQYTAFSEQNILPANRLHVTGSPRYDLCHEKWRVLLDYPKQDFVLLNTNFPTINPLFTGSHEKEVESLVSVGWGRTYIESVFADMRTLIDRYLGAFTVLARRNPELHFLVRPHPFENMLLYTHQFSDLRNVTVEGSGSVFNVINNATCVLHLNCQSSVETTLLGKLPVSMEFLNTERLRTHFPLPSQISYPAKSFDELETIVRNPHLKLKETERAAVFEKYIKPWFNTIDGKASERVADILIDKTPAAHSLRRSRFYMRSMTGSRDKFSYSHTAMGLLSNIVGSRAVSDVRRLKNPRRNTKYISSDFMARYLHRIAQVDGRKLELRTGHPCHPIVGAPLATVRIVATDSTR